MTDLGAEEIGWRLLAALRDAVGSDLDFSMLPSPLTGGAFSTNYGFELARPPAEWSGRLVLRMVEGTSLDVLREAALQEGARVSGVPAPRVLLVEPSAEVLGAPFMVMEFMSGRPFLGGIEWHRFARDFPKMVARWPATFRVAIGLLASTDVAPAIAAATRYRVPAHELHTTRHLRRIEEVLGASPGWAKAVGWLTTNQPALPDPLHLVHGDLWPANVLMVRGQIGGLVDWTMAGLGDPALDVGFAKAGLALMPEPFPPPAPISTAIRAAGRRMARQIHEASAPSVGGGERIAYYEALRCMAQVAAVEADRQQGRTNGWEHGVPALTSYFNGVTGLNIDCR